MASTPASWSVDDVPAEADVAVLVDGVVNYGRSQAVGGDPRPIACFLREDGRVIAGACGRIEFARLFIHYVWVDDQRRGAGLGREALARIEKAAEQRGARDALIETLSDRTAVLYGRLGYQPLAVIEHYVNGFHKHVMRKPLPRVSG